MELNKDIIKKLKRGQRRFNADDIVKALNLSKDELWEVMKKYGFINIKGFAYFDKQILFDYEPEYAKYYKPKRGGRMYIPKNTVLIRR